MTAQLAVMSVAPQLKSVPDLFSDEITASLDHSEEPGWLDLLDAARVTEEAVNQRLQMVETIRNDFVWSVTHELRTPITNILGYSEVLQSGEPGPLSTEQFLMLDRVVANGTRLLTLVEDLLRTARIEVGDLAFTPVGVNVCDLVAGAVAHATGALCDKQLEIAVDLNPTPVLVQADPRDLLVMVNSLLCNAMKFTPDGGHLSVTVGSVDDECLVLVSDSGCGIPAEEQPLVFDRFYRSSISSRMAIPGTGLGLSTAQAIATMHGGRIEVESAVGMGSCFAVVLPLAGAPTLAGLQG